MPEVALVLRIFALLNPLASIPMLAVAREEGLDVRAVALRATALALTVALAFVAAGPILFQVYGISLHSFRAAGGLLVLLLGLSMAREAGKGSTERRPDALISLIATPLLTGPATLSYVILLAAERGRLTVTANLAAAFLLVGGVFYVFALLLPRVNLTYLGFVSRLLGLFLVAMGIEMLVGGLLAVAGASGVLPR